MSKVTGVVEAKSGKSKYGTYGILVDGTWYNSYDPIPAEKGDTVELEVKGKKITNITVTGSGGAVTSKPSVPRSVGRGGYVEQVFPVPDDHPMRFQVRQSAILRAAELVGKAMPVASYYDPNMAAKAIQDAIALATIVEKYLSGEIDSVPMSNEVPDEGSADE